MADAHEWVRLGRLLCVRLVPLTNPVRLEICRSCITVARTATEIARGCGADAGLVSKHAQVLWKAGAVLLESRTIRTVAAPRPGGWCIGSERALFMPHIPCKDAASVAARCRAAGASPTRCCVLLYLCGPDAPISPAGVARTLGVSVQVASYHLRALARAGYAARYQRRNDVRYRPTERVAYSVKQRAVVLDEFWVGMPMLAREASTVAEIKSARRRVSAR